MYTSTGENTAYSDEQNAEAGPGHRSLLDNPSIQAGLGDRRIFRALVKLVSDPSAIQVYINDPVVGPFLLEFQRILRSYDDAHTYLSRLVGQSPS